MVRYLLLFITLIYMAQPLAAQQNRNAFSRQEVIQDLRYLAASLEQTHYNLYAYTSKNKFNHQYQKVVKSVSQDSLSTLEATTLFQRVIAEANTGHAEIDFPAQFYIEYAQRDGTVFPLELALEQGKAYIRRNFSPDMQLATGAEIVSINGQPIATVIREIHPQLSAERQYLKNAKLEFWSFPRLFWQIRGKVDSFDVEIIDQGKKAHYSVSAISVIDYETKRQGEILNYARHLRFFNQAAYLSPGPFSNTATSNEAHYQQFIDSAFYAVRQQRSPTLIVDLRNNAGGNNSFSDYLLAYIAQQPFKWHSAFYVKSSKLLKEQTRLHNDTTDAYFKAILAHPDGQAYPYPYADYLPVDQAQRFAGKVYILINRQTYSMAAVAAAQAQDYGFATLVGEETGDTPTLYASQFSYPLPHTGVVVKVPKGYIVRPNGNEALAGVRPDIPIKDHLLDEHDEILTTLLKTL